MRAQAESEYSSQLFAISDSNHLNSISVGLLGEEVESFKADCRSKAKAAAELAENVAQDCVEPLRKLIEEQDDHFKALINESRVHISTMDGVNNRIRGLAHRYFEASENAEKFIHNYQELKMNIDIPFQKRKSIHESVLSSMSIAKEKEQAYKDSLSDAN